MYCSRVARYNDGQKDKKLSLGMLKVQYIHTISYIVHKYSLKENYYISQFPVNVKNIY